MKLFPAGADPSYLTACFASLWAANSAVYFDAKMEAATRTVGRTRPRRNGLARRWSAFRHWQVAKRDQGW